MKHEVLNHENLRQKKPLDIPFEHPEHVPPAENNSGVDR
jgi:hypothetical protein